MSALAGLRVLDLTRLLPGGYCTLLLADHGADVIKVEDTGAGDYVRADPPSFASLNRGKRSIQLDLKSDGGRLAFLRLAAGADVVIESFRPGVMDRLGVGFEVLREANPALVYCAITGYGQDGPLRLRAGHDLNYLARTGVLGLSGEGDGPPVQAAAQIADLAGGALMAAFGVLAALRSGKGQFVDISMADGALSLLAMPVAGMLAGGPAPRRGELTLGGRLLCYRPYRAADGWVSMGALEPKFWAAFCRGVEREDLVQHQFDPPGSAAHAEVEAVLAARTRAEWEAFNAEHDCCLEPVLELEEAISDEHVRARGMVADGLLATPVKLSATPGDSRRGPPPGLGEHTGEVLAEAGYDAAEIAALRSARSREVSAFFVALGDGRYRATERTSGPWDPRHQHAGPPSALLTGLLERTSPRDDMVLARVTVEILGAVPIADVEVETSVERPGRSVELLAGELRADGRPVLRARAWRVLASPVGTPSDPPAEPPGAAERPPPSLGEVFGYAHAIEWRWERGGWEDRGPAAVWTRMRIPLVEGEEPSPRQRVMVVADSGNGVSNVLDWGRYLFINTELTVHFLREPVGEWVLLDAQTQIAEGGAGLASSVLSDGSGPVACGAQALLVAPR